MPLEISQEEREFINNVRSPLINVRECIAIGRLLNKPPIEIMRAFQVADTIYQIVTRES